jgi:hypothetical protein
MKISEERIGCMLIGGSVLIVLILLLGLVGLYIASRNTSGAAAPSPSTLSLPQDACVIDGKPQISVGLTRDSGGVYPSISYLRNDGAYVVYDNYSSFAIAGGTCPTAAAR